MDLMQARQVCQLPRLEIGLANPDRPPIIGYFSHNFFLPLSTSLYALLEQPEVVIDAF